MALGSKAGKKETNNMELTSIICLNFVCHEYIVLYRVMCVYIVLLFPQDVY